MQENLDQVPLALTMRKSWLSALKKGKISMENFYKFASEHPWLTFFLFVIVGETLVGLAEALRG